MARRRAAASAEKLGSLQGDGGHRRRRVGAVVEGGVRVCLCRGAISSSSPARRPVWGSWYRVGSCAARSARPTAALAATQGPGLSDPALQPKFANVVPNALDPGFIYDTSKGKIKVGVGQTVQYTGLVGPDGVDAGPDHRVGLRRQQVLHLAGPHLPGAQQRAARGQVGEPAEDGCHTRSSPARTTPASASATTPAARWSTPACTGPTACTGYEQYTIEKDGVPDRRPRARRPHRLPVRRQPGVLLQPRLRRSAARSGSTRSTSTTTTSRPARSGTTTMPSASPGSTSTPAWPASTSSATTSTPGCSATRSSLPAFPYEAAFAIQDRMFKDNGELFYPAFPGDPFYDDFITGEGRGPADPTSSPAAGRRRWPSSSATTWWSTARSGRRWTSSRATTACASSTAATAASWRCSSSRCRRARPTSARATGPLPFTVIGSDQGLASSPTTVDTLLMETGSRYDVIFDFKNVTPGNRVIMKNIGGDEPFGGDIPGPQVFGETDRIMAFDVVLPLDTAVPDVTPTGINFGPVVPAPTRLRKVALFEGMDEFGRLQPLLGTAEPATDYAGQPDQLAEHAGVRQRRPGRPDGRLDRLAQPDDREPGPRLHRGVGDLERHRRRPPGAPAPGALRDPGSRGDRVGLAHDRGRPGHPQRRLRRSGRRRHLPGHPAGGAAQRAARQRVPDREPDVRRRRAAAGRVRRERPQGHGHGAARARSPGSRRPSTSRAATSGTATSCPTRTTR